MLRISPQPNLVLSQNWPPKPESQHPAPAWVSVVSWAMIPMVYVVLSLIFPSHSSCFAFLWGFKFPPPSWLIYPSVYGLPGCTFFTLSQLPLRTAGVVLIQFFSSLCLSFFLFVLPSYLEGFLPFLEVKCLLPVLNSYSVRIILP